MTHEYLTKRESPCGESGLHRRSPDLTPELQSTVWADEVVMAAQELKMFFELVLRTRMGERFAETERLSPVGWSDSSVQ